MSEIMLWLNDFGAWLGAGLTYFLLLVGAGMTAAREMLVDEVYSVVATVITLFLSLIPALPSGYNLSTLMGGLPSSAVDMMLAAHVFQRIGVVMTFVIPKFLLRFIPGIRV